MAAAPLKPEIGLCANCRHTRVVVSGKGSQFFYCARSESDDHYAKYPRLPVLHCVGYQVREKEIAQE